MGDNVVFGSASDYREIIETVIPIITELTEKSSNTKDKNNLLGML